MPECIIEMSRQQEEPQITCKYLFVITPLEIQSTSKLKTHCEKVLLIKLGNKTAKCRQMGTPLQLQVDVLYSGTLAKFCPIKGIIKIYDVSQDGAEIISCVGGFQTDELLNEGKTQVLLEKDIGTSKLKMDIVISRKSAKAPQKKDNPGQASRLSESRSSREKRMPAKAPAQPSSLTSPKSEMGDRSSVASDTFSTSDRRMNTLLNRPVEIPHKNTSSNINKSLEKINQALNFKRFEENGASKANEVLHRAEVETVRQQLAEERRKNALLEEKAARAKPTESSGSELQQSRREVAILKKLTAEKEKKINALEGQLEGMEKTIQNMKETNRHVQEENQYLREKNDQVEMTLYHRESALEGLRKQLAQLDQQAQELEAKLYNAGLENEELREEVSNCTQTIDRYREKYGDLKNTKNRQIEYDIKECIRWLDQQNRDLEMSEMEETVEPPDSCDHTERDDSLSSVIRNIEIEKVPLEEMSVIRNELVRILEKVDTLMGK